MGARDIHAMPATVAFLHRLGVSGRIAGLAGAVGMGRMVGHGAAGVGFVIGLRIGVTGAGAIGARGVVVSGRTAGFVGWRFMVSTFLPGANAHGME
jgi:hypothetical protein